MSRRWTKYRRGPTQVLVTCLALVTLVGCGAIARDISGWFRLDKAEVGKIYDDYKSSSLTSIETGAYITAGLVGAAAVAIPVLHLVTVFIDLTVMKGIISGLPYKIGSSIGSAAGCGNIVEPEDMDNVLYGIVEITHLVEAATVLKSANAAASSLTKVNPISASNFYESITGMVDSISGHTFHFAPFATVSAIGAKGISATLFGKYLAKFATGFVPLLGPAISGGLNLYIVSSVVDASEAYYRIKAHGCPKV